MMDVKGSSSSGVVKDKDMHASHKEWDDTCCPICMDHPHNAVLLICSSHEKGCRPYICDTSYRHSNCLDRFKKLKANENDPSQPPVSSVSGALTGGGGGGDLFQSHSSFKNEEDDLKCPLCRGSVMGWIIKKEAREYLDLKMRSCSRELCSFSGDYRELRRHARRVHPRTRPCDVDPSRQRAWRRLEHQTEYGDVLSAIGASPAAVVLGDYVIDNNGDPYDGGVLSSSQSRDRDLELRARARAIRARDIRGDESGSSSRGNLLTTTLFLFQMIGSPIPSSLEGARSSSSSSRSWRVHRRSSVGLGHGHRHYRSDNLWGSNLLGLRDNDDDDDRPMPRRRRRFTRSRPSDDEDDDTQS